VSLLEQDKSIEEQNAEIEKYANWEFGPRSFAGVEKWLLVLIATSWSIFQFLLPMFLTIPSDQVRAIHLAFAIALVFLSFPVIKNSYLTDKLKGRFRFLTKTQGASWLDYLLGIIAVISVLYYIFEKTGLEARQGNPIASDFIFGTIMLLLLLEAARRALGPALPCVAIVFIVYSFFSEYMPSFLAFQNASWTKIINQLTMSSQGVYGVPLDVSAQVVFLFVLFGAMLEKAGGGYYFIQLALSALGRFRGGPAKAAVLASGLTGMVNGSSIANTVTTGTFTIPLMKKTGFSAVKAGAVEVAASTNGQLMPPIMGAAAFIIAEYCNITYFEVVKAAFIPAFISYIALIYITHLESLKIDLKPLDKSDIPPFWKTLFGGLHFLIPLFFLLYQLIIERRSAQYSVFWAIVALAGLILVVELIKSGRKVKDGLINAFKIILDSLVAGGRNMMTIGVAVGAAGIIVGIVALGLGSTLTELIGYISGGSLIIMLLITALVSLILGMGLPTTANYIVMASLTVPAIVALAGETGYAVPLIAAHLFCFYFGILSDDTPPVGLSAYAAAAISGADPIKTGIQGFKYDIRTAILPFMFFFNTDLLLIGVTSWSHITIIFCSGVIAMFAFAALTQNHLLVKNRIWDAVILLSSTAVLLRPDLFERWTGQPVWIWYIIGALLFGIVHLMQWPRRKES
jgi:TRAP transporter 4TM/12TM fusion protein